VLAFCNLQLQFASIKTSKYPKKNWQLGRSEYEAAYNFEIIFKLKSKLNILKHLAISVRHMEGTTL
jgi:hypothetical protein